MNESRARRIVLMVWLVAATAVPAPEPIPADPPLPASIRSDSGRFTVVGRDSAQSFLLVRWAETVAGRVEPLLNEPLVIPADQFVIACQLETNRVDGRISAMLEPYGSRWVSRVRVMNPDGVDPFFADHALCGQLLRWWLAGATNPALSRAAVVTHALPEWFVTGMVENLTRERKAANSERCYRAWESGTLPPIRSLFGTNAPVDKGYDPGTNGMERAQAGLMVGWILQVPRSAGALTRLRERWASGLPVTAEWIGQVLWGYETVGDVTDGWDRWMERQKRMIYRPGTPTRMAVESLRAELWSMPGLQGMPAVEKTGGLVRPVNMADLARYRKEPWFEGFARNKAMRLQLLMLGQGPVFEKAVRGYLDYLEALTRWTTRGRLERLLKEADVAMTELERITDGSSGL